LRDPVGGRIGFHIHFLLKKSIMEQTLVHIHGEIAPEGNNIWVNGTALKLATSLAIWKYSPAGFDWGFRGIGANQAALGICLEIFKSPHLALEFHQMFFETYTIKWPMHQEFDEIIRWGEFIEKNVGLFYHAWKRAQSAGFPI
jgi:hypothetical protein